MFCQLLFPSSKNESMKLHIYLVQNVECCSVKPLLKQHNIELILLVVLWLIAVQQWNPMMAVCVFIFWSSSTAKPEMASPSIPKCRAWRILGKSTTVLPSPSPETGTVKWMYCKGRSAFCLSAAGYFRCHSIYFNRDNSNMGYYLQVKSIFCPHLKNISG